MAVVPNTTKHSTQKDVASRTNIKKVEPSLNLSRGTNIELKTLFVGTRLQMRRMFLSSSVLISERICDVIRQQLAAYKPHEWPRSLQAFSLDWIGASAVNAALYFHSRRSVCLAL
eukprot:TRINITY_DN24022_c0_g1_i4.p2 TRINITY_DN24022_c0_g1~~TRINITY_DN24022_c0_g1_i4.p2  ORF type:complete len:115 (-),score=1.38 TRINITY_DN24022_c0_g1_i4:29-373(-)